MGAFVCVTVTNMVDVPSGTILVTVLVGFPAASVSVTTVGVRVISKVCVPVGRPKLFFRVDVVSSSKNVFTLTTPFGPVIVVVEGSFTIFWTVVAVGYPRLLVKVTVLRNPIFVCVKVKVGTPLLSEYTSTTVACTPSLESDITPVMTC